MANPIVQYLRDTRNELNHVAWPTQRQTAIFTILVAAISLGVAAYLGAFDYIFRGALADVLNVYGASSAVQVTQQPAATTTSSGTAAQAPVTTGPTFTVTPSTGSTNPTQ